MRLARKFTIAIALAMLLVLTGHEYLFVRQAVTLFDADLERTEHLKRLLRASIESVWRAYGDTAAQQLVDEAAKSIEGASLRWLWLDAPTGDPRYVNVTPEQRATLARNERVRFEQPNEKGETWRYTYLPISIEGSRPGVMAAAESLRRQHEFIRTSKLQTFGAATVILVLCIATVYGVGLRFIGQPVQRLRDKARAVGAGDFGAPLILPQHDEIGELAQELNAMCDHLRDAQDKLAAETDARIAAIEHMRHTDRLTTIGQLASGVAHELGTPLSVIIGRAEMISSGEVQGDKVADNGRVIVEQAKRMSALIRQLLDFSRRHGPRFGLASLRAIAARSVDMLASFARKRAVVLELGTSTQPLLVAADEHQIQQALTNIIMNAVQAMPDGGRVTVALTTTDERPAGVEPTTLGTWACIGVEDHGAGIPPEHLSNVFEPFFTTKNVGEGTGLGLSVASGIVREHGGRIEVASEVGRGTSFSILLPLASEPVTRTGAVS